MAVRNLQFVLSGSDKSASKSLQRVGKRADGLASKLSGIGKAAAFGAAGAAAAIGGGLAAALVKGVQGASDLAESQSKVNTVFGESSTVIRKFSNSAARDLGMTKQAALEATGTFGNLFSALGIGIKPAAEMSTKLVTLATDLGSFNNVDSEEALLALRSGLLGEAEPLRKFGVSLSAARIEAEAFALGLVKPVKDVNEIRAAQNKITAAVEKVSVATQKHGKHSIEVRQAVDARVRAEAGLTKAMKGQKVELTAAQKAQAAYAVILKDTKVAQGDFARTSGGLANQTKILKAQLSDTTTSIGAQLLPVLTRAATFVNDEVVPAVNRFIDQFVRGVGPGGEFRDTVTEVADTARDAATYIDDVYRSTKTVVDFVLENKNAFAGIIGGLVAYRTAMLAAAAANVVFGTSAAGAGIGGAVGGAKAGGVGGKVAKGGKLLGIAGVVGGVGGMVDSAYIDAQGRYKDTVLPDGRINRFDGKTGTWTILPAPPRKVAPRPGGSSLDRSVKNVTPTTPTYRDQRTAGSLVVQNTLKVGQREMANSTTDYQGSRLVRGYVPAY